MKNNKEIQLAEKDFLKAARLHQLSAFENATFIPYNPVIHYNNQKWALLGAATCATVFLYLLYNALAIDSIYYWQIDLPVVVGLMVISVFSILSIGFLLRYRQLDHIIDAYMKNPKETYYGALLTPEYYFERTPEAYHIIAKANIIRIDYEEQRSPEETYVELLIDRDDTIETRGVIYNPQVVDFKSWCQS